MEYVDGPVTQVFGAGRDLPWQLGYGHLGEDKGIPVGTVARTIADGEVIFAGWAAQCPVDLKNQILVMGDAPGIFVWIRHQDQHGPWESLTCHLNETHLNAGNRVRRGDVIGKSGNTGLSTGPHTHYETFTRPCSSVPPFSRYNPRLQIDNENARFGAGTGAPATPAAPAPLPADVRKVGGAGATQRNAPNRGGQVIRTIEPGKTERFTGWVRGENVLIPGETGVRVSIESDVWFKDADGYIWAGGFENPGTAGLPDQTPVPAPNQRRVVSPGAVQRNAPSTTATEVRSITGDTIETFTHWARGDSVDGTDVWYKDNLGYVSASRFTNRSTDGLPEFINLAANQRRVGPAGATQRNAPNRDGAVVRNIAPNTTETFTHYTRGETVTSGGTTTDLWYRDVHGYVWAGGFTTQSTTGLAEHVHGSTPPAPLPSTPAPTPGADYVFTKAFDFVTEVRPAAQGNFERGNFPAPAQVADIVVHQFNADEVADNPTVNKVTVHLDSVINTFQGNGRVASAHFGVEGTRVVQFVDLGDRAYAQGPDGNGQAWSIETYGAQDPVTMATAAKLIAALEVRGGKKNLRRHLDIMATKCGNGVNLTRYRELVDQLSATPTVPPPAPGPVQQTAEDVLRAIQALISTFFGRK